MVGWLVGVLEVFEGKEFQPLKFSVAGVAAFNEMAGTGCLGDAGSEAAKTLTKLLEHKKTVNVLKVL